MILNPQCKRFTALCTYLGLLFSSAVTAGDVMYDDVIYLQNGGMDHRWLSGCRSSGNIEVITRNAKMNQYESKSSIKTYQWKIKSCLDHTCGDSDPKSSSFMKYGDIIYLESKCGLKSWLSGSRTAGNKVVRTYDYFNNTDNFYKSAKASAHYQCIVRSYPAMENGFLPYTNDDSAHGLCVKNSGLLFLQNAGIDSRWLTGARRAGNEDVETRDYFSTENSSYESKFAPKS